MGRKKNPCGLHAVDSWRTPSEVTSETEISEKFGFFPIALCGGGRKEHVLQYSLRYANTTSATGNAFRLRESNANEENRRNNSTMHRSLWRKRLEKVRSNPDHG